MRHGLVNAPKEVVGKFLGGRRLEVGGLDGRGGDALQDLPAGAVLAARVHALKKQDQRVAAVGVEELLEAADLLAQARGFLAGFILVQARVPGGIEIAERDFGIDLDWLGHGAHSHSRAGQGRESI